MKFLSETSVNIEDYTREVNDTFKVVPQTEIVIGDLHANALKFGYFLVRHGILNIAEKYHKDILRIYNIPPDELTQGDWLHFQFILECARPGQVKLVKLLGDITGDTGRNDWFMLLILKALSTQQINFKMLWSNHDAEFIKAYEKWLQDSDEKHFFKTRMPGQDSSLRNLGILLQRKVISREMLIDLVENYYYPCLDICSYTYTYSKGIEKLAIAFHAHNGIDTVKALAKEFGVVYDDSIARKLAFTIDQINKGFQAALKTHSITEKSQIDEIDGVIRLERADVQYPIVRAMWHIGYNDILVPSHHNGYKLKYLFGHSGNGKVDKEFEGVIWNFDNQLGKSKDKHQNEIYSVGFFKRNHNDRVYLSNSSTREHHLSLMVAPDIRFMHT